MIRFQDLKPFHCFFMQAWIALKTVAQRVGGLQFRRFFSFFYARLCTPEFFLFLFLFFCFFASLGLPSLFTPDEGRYAEIAREMLLGHAWIVPHLDGVIYFEKPPLSYWFTTLSFHFFGLNEWAARIPVALLGFLGSLYLYYVGRVLFSRRTGLFAAFIVGTSLLYLVCSHLLITDNVFTFFLSASLLSFLIAEQKKRPFFYDLAYVFSALAVLAKGLIGIVFPMTIIGLWILLSRDFSVLKRMHIVRGGFLFLVLVLPWHILAGLEVKSFWHQYFYVQQFLRYTTPIMSREMPFWQYALIVAALLFPWCFLLPAALRSAWKKRHDTDSRQSPALQYQFLLDEREQDFPKEGIKTGCHSLNRVLLFLLSWIGVIFTFFAFSNSILIPYLLPLSAPLSLFLAQYLNLKWDLYSPFFKRTLLIFPLVFALFFSGFWIVLPHFVNRSVKPLAEITNVLLKADPALSLANLGYYQDYPFYTRHLVTIVDWDNELNYGASIDPSVTWLISGKQYWSTWAQPPHKVLVLSRRNYQSLEKQHTFYVLAATPKDLLVANFKP